MRNCFCILFSSVKKPGLAGLVVCAVLAGCSTEKGIIKIPLPVVCNEVVPDRPVMPTESLVPGVEPFVLTRAALAEIDRREAYEIKMRAALVACTAPVTSFAPRSASITSLIPAVMIGRHLRRP